MDEEKIYSILSLFKSIDDDAKGYIDIADIYLVLEPNNISIENDEIIINSKYKYKEEECEIYTKIKLKIDKNNNIEFRKDEKIVSKPNVIISGNKFDNSICYNTLLINIEFKDSIKLIYNKDCSNNKDTYKNVYDMNNKPKISKIENNNLKNDIVSVINELRNDLKR